MNPFLCVLQIRITILLFRTLAHIFQTEQECLLIWVHACCFLEISSEFPGNKSCCVSLSIEVIVCEFSWLRILWLYMKLRFICSSNTFSLMYSPSRGSWANLESKPNWLVYKSAQRLCSSPIWADWKPLHKCCFWVFNFLQLVGRFANLQ